MSIKRKKTTIEELPEWEAEKKEEEIDSEDQEMESIRNSLPGGVRCISVYRMHKAGLGGRPKFIAEIPPEQFRESFIQEVYGGGSYFGRWTKKDGSTIRYPFDIEGPEKILESAQDHHQRGGEEEEQRQISIQPAQPTGMNPMDVMRMIQDARKEAREEMRMMLELMRPTQQTPDMTKQVFDIVEKIAPMMSGGDGGGSPLMMVLAQFKEPIIKLVDSISSAAMRPAQPVYPSTGRPTIQPNPASAPTQSEEDMIKLMVKQFLPVFINAATKNADPNLYADMVLDQVPESAYPKLKEWLEKSTCLEEIASLEPGVRYQQEWWNSLRASILMAMLEHANNLQSSATSIESEQDS